MTLSIVAPRERPPPMPANAPAAAKGGAAGAFRSSLLSCGAGRRLAVAGGLAALLWFAVAWALDWLA